MNILITGASGVIGLKLVEHFAHNTDAVIDACYFSESSDLIQLSHTFPGRVRPMPYRDIIQMVKPIIYDQIWHFATYGQPARFIDSWMDVVELNSEHIIKLSSLLADNGVFNYASTSELYSSLSQATEQSVPTSYPHGVRSIYTESKRLGEAICSTIFTKERHLIFRICLAYSDKFRFDDRRVLYELVMKGLIDGYITLLDSGSAKRQYIFIDDAIRMMINLSGDYRRLEYPDSVFNIANNNPITIMQLATRISDIIECPVYPGKLNNFMGALDSVEVVPKRYTELYPEFEFTDIAQGLTAVVDSGRRMLSFSENL